MVRILFCIFVHLCSILHCELYDLPITLCHDMVALPTKAMRGIFSCTYSQINLQDKFWNLLPLLFSNNCIVCSEVVSGVPSFILGGMRLKEGYPIFLYCVIVICLWLRSPCKISEPYNWIRETRRFFFLIVLNTTANGSARPPPRQKLVASLLNGESLSAI